MKKKLFGSMGDSLKSNAVLIILSVCVLIAGGVSYYTVSDINDKLNNQKVTQPQKPPVQEKEEELQNVQKQGENVPLSPTPAPSAKPTPSQPPASTSAPEEPSVQEAPAPQGFTLPVDGEIYNAFSRDELVYNRSMDDWRTHNGIDIKAPKDSQVRAGSQGIVENVYNDGMLGTVIDIKTDDHIVKYCGLNENVSIKKGDSVTAGQILGTVGEIPLELSEGAHIHLEVIKNGQSIDPAQLIK